MANLCIGRHIKSSIKSTTRIDAQVIRGFAVVIVILYHLKIGVMNSGYVGVDIFFVLSGYFIYENIRDYQTFAEFIKARIKRLYPSLLVISLSTYTFAYYLLSDLDRFKKIDFVASILFLENIKLLFESSNYFRSEFNPFIHLWTIAIELQFYIMAFFLIKKYRFNIFILLFVSFCIWTIFLLSKDINSFVYIPFSRFWEFLVGVVASKYRDRKFKNDFKLRIGLLILTLVSTTNLTKYYYPFVIMTSVIITYYLIHNTWRTSKIMRPLIDIGNKSYSIYLVHLPIIIFTYLYVENKFMRICISLILILIIANINYYLIEKPTRYKNNKIYYIAIGILIISQLINTQNTKKEEVNSADNPWSWSKYASNCESKILEICNFGENNELLILGDSHAEMIFDQLYQNIDIQKKGIKFIHNSTTTISNLELTDTRELSGFIPNNNELDQFLSIIDQSQPKTILITERYTWRLGLNYFGRTELRESYGKETFCTVDFFGNCNGNDTEVIYKYVSNIERIVSHANSRNVKVLFVMSFPEFKRIPRDNKHFEKFQNFDVTRSIEELTYRRGISTNLLKTLQISYPNFYLIDPLKIICDETKCNYLDNNNQLMFVDDNHLNNLGASYVVKSILDITNKRID